MLIRRGVVKKNYPVIFVSLYTTNASQKVSLDRFIQLQTTPHVSGGRGAGRSIRKKPYTKQKQLDSEPNTTGHSTHGQPACRCQPTSFVGSHYSHGCPCFRQACLRARGEEATGPRSLPLRPTAPYGEGMFRPAHLGALGITVIPSFL